MPVIAARPPTAPGHFYVDETTAEDIETFNMESLPRPEIGKVYLRYLGREEDFFSQHHLGRRNNYNWYHKRLPAALKKLGLTVERVPLTAVAVNPVYPGDRLPERRAHAWRVAAGLEEFKRRPLALFASHAQMKADTVTLGQLEAAAEKFNLSRAQLEVMNDYLTAAGAPRTGAYYPATGRVQLANRSLATLAHEGLHHLATAGLIPAADYKALVAAGQRQAQAAAAQGYFTPAPGQPAAYPTAPLREQEAAALFVENYYLTTPRARKKLIGTQLTAVEKILDYAERVFELIAAAFGHAPARARAFLRRVEQGQCHASAAGRGPARPRQPPSPAWEYS